MNETIGIVFAGIIGFIIGLFIMRFVYQKPDGEKK